MATWIKAGRPFVFILRICTVHLRYTSMSILRGHTYISIERTDILTTIKDLLWQAGLRQPSSKPPKNYCPSAPYLLSCGAFFCKSRCSYHLVEGGLENE